MVQSPVIDTWRGEFRACENIYPILIIAPLIQNKLHFHFAQKADPGSPGQKSRGYGDPPRLSNNRSHGGHLSKMGR
jgi:hypothetical protein